MKEMMKGMPPAIILTCEIDSLRDEGEEYGKKPLADAGHQMMIEGLRKYLL